MKGKIRANLEKFHTQKDISDNTEEGSESTVSTLFYRTIFRAWGPWPSLPLKMAEGKRAQEAYVQEEMLGEDKAVSQGRTAAQSNT
jgi:hypothetical protein